MDLRQEYAELARTISAELVMQSNGTMSLEAVAAERRSILSRKRLVYVCRVRVNERTHVVRFFEMLKEVELGLSVGGVDGGMSPGLGFKREVFALSGKERRGTIEERSRLLGSDYTYRFDPEKFRDMLRQAATGAGYSFEVTLVEKSV
jgi:hypothetical protein